MQNFVKPVLHAWKFFNLSMIRELIFVFQSVLCLRKERTVNRVGERAATCTIHLMSRGYETELNYVYKEKVTCLHQRSSAYFQWTLWADHHCSMLVASQKFPLTLIHNKFEFEKWIIELESLQYGNVHRIKIHLQLQRLTTSYGPAIDLHNRSGSIDVLIFPFTKDYDFFRYETSKNRLATKSCS